MIVLGPMLTHGFVRKIRPKPFEHNAFGRQTCRAYTAVVYSHIDLPAHISARSQEARPSQPFGVEQSAVHIEDDTQRQIQVTQRTPPNCSTRIAKSHRF
jgi:hypothetical protein